MADLVLDDLDVRSGRALIRGLPGHRIAIADGAAACCYRLVMLPAGVLSALMK